MRHRFLALFAGVLVVLLLAGPAASAAPTSPTVTTPGVPSKVTAVAGHETVLLAWLPPASSGGSAVTGYVITASPGGQTARTTAVTSFTIGNLTDGTSYTFKVAAVNGRGTGAQSRPSPPATPTAPIAPAAPAAPTATPAFQAASVSWGTPVSTHGAPITGYTVTAQPGGQTVTTDGAARQALLSGLTNGTSYSVTVAASNSAGTSPPAAAGTVVPAVTAPTAPASVQAASSGNGAVALAWAAPLNDGGSPVTGYTVNTSPGGQSTTLPADATSTTVTGLTAGTAYTFTVTASNAVGNGAAAVSAPTAPDATPAAQTVVLTADSQAALTVHTDGSLTFTNAPAQVTGLQPGDVLASGVSTSTPDGLLRTVQTVTTSGGTTSVTTSPAAISDAISTGDLAVGSTLGSGQVASFRGATPGVHLAAPDRASGVSTDGLNVTIDSYLYKDTRGHTVHVTGGVHVTPTISLAASISCCIHTSSHFTASVTSSADLKLVAQLTHTLSGGIVLGDVRFEPITVFVAGVPVVLIPTLHLELNATGTVTAGVTTSASESDTYGVDLTSRDGTVNATPINSHRSSYTPPTLFDALNAQVGPSAQLTVLVDDIAGPYVTDQLWLKLAASTTANPWWTVSAENVVGAGFTLSVLGHKLADWHASPLFDTTVKLADAGGPFMGVTITPDPATTGVGKTLQLTAAVQRSPDQTVTWSVPAGAGSITNSGLYTAPGTPGVYRVTATSPASGLKPQTQGTSSIRVGGQPPVAPTNITANSTSRGTATITWTAPTDTGGLPLTGYRISSIPASGTASASGSVTTFKVAGLTPAGTYQFTVTATNNAGIGPPSAASSPVLIVDQNTTTVRDWGANLEGELGNGTTTNSTTPVQVSGLTGVTAIASGAYTGYALLADGTVRAWGYGGYGELGNGTTTSTTPVQVNGLTRVTAIASGTDSEAGYALLTDGTVRAWGYNGDGQLGNGSTNNSSTPVQVSGLTGVTAIAGGYFDGYALLADGTVRTWGNNDYGQLGNGTTTSSSTPVQVSGLTGVTAIAASDRAGYALLSDGTVRAWGDNLGNGDLSASSSSPVQVGGLTGVTAIAGGATDGYALLSDGTVQAWGGNGGGGLGDGKNDSPTTPVPVSGLTGVTAVAGGSDGAYALLADGTVRAWGNGGAGQLGNGTTTGISATPVQVSGLTGVTAIASGYDSGYALRR